MDSALRFVGENWVQLAAGAYALWEIVSSRKSSRKDKLKAIVAEVRQRLARRPDQDEDDWGSVIIELVAELKRRGVKLPSKGEMAMLLGFVEALRARETELAQEKISPEELQRGLQRLQRSTGPLPRPLAPPKHLVE
jgi:hypothetical protein